jgi:7-cyano-7-deazaguanine reductase
LSAPDGPGAPEAEARPRSGSGAIGPVGIGTEHLTILGREHRAPVAHVECFDAPPDVRVVRFRTEEVSSRCPVTGQPDLSSVLIEYRPDRRCVESKSLKLYLWSFHDRAVFAEALAAEIATEIDRSAQPHHVRVTLTQRPRGGITIEAVAERGREPEP